MAVMAVREGLEFESSIESDSAPLSAPVLALISQGVEIHCLRDITRGGLTSVLNELAAGSGHSIHVEEAKAPVREDVRAACEILGFDPLQVACEGRMVAIVPESQVDRVLAIWRGFEVTAGAAVIGRVGGAEKVPRVLIRNSIGIQRILDMSSGEQLPRIC